MNERIRSLADQAELNATLLFNKDKLEKFAQLIVAECTSVFDGSKEMKTVGFLSHEQVVKQIKQHFGVEE